MVAVASSRPTAVLARDCDSRTSRTCAEGDGVDS
jgi:hypothetical protein